MRARKVNLYAFHGGPNPHVLKPCLPRDLPPMELIAPFTIFTEAVRVAAPGVPVRPALYLISRLLFGEMTRGVSVDLL